MAIAKAQPKPKVLLSPGPAPVVKVVKPAPKVVVKAAPKVVAKPVAQAPAPPNSLQYNGSDAAQSYSSSGGGGGSVAWNPGPNYGADLVGEPDFTEANARYTENVNLAHQQRQQRIRAALIKLGFQPGSANAAALEGIDPSTADLAQNNSASALAKLGLQRGTDRADLSAQLAGRGILDSGALRGGENMVQSTYDQGLLGATQDYLSEQDTALGDEASTLATGQSTYTAAKAAAALAAARNPLFTPTYSGAADQGDTLAAGQGTRPDQTPVLAAAPKLPQQPVVKPPAKFTPPAGTKFYAYKAQVPLRPGQTLKFFNGRYYAG